MDDAENPWLLRARDRKAYRLARVMLRAIREHGATLEQVEHADSTVRARAAELARVRHPSAATWRRVVELVRDGLAK